MTTQLDCQPAGALHSSACDRAAVFAIGASLGLHVSGVAHVDDSGTDFAVSAASEWDARGCNLHVHTVPGPTFRTSLS